MTGALPDAAGVAGATAGVTGAVLPAALGRAVRCWLLRLPEAISAFLLLPSAVLTCCDGLEAAGPALLLLGAAVGLSSSSCASLSRMLCSLALKSPLRGASLSGSWKRDA